MNKNIKSLTTFLITGLVVLFFLGAIALWIGGLYVPRYVKNQVAKNTEFRLEIHSSHVNFLYGLVDFRDIVLTNPPRFEDKELAIVKQLKVDVEMSPRLIWNRDISKIVVQEMILDVENLQLVINKAGENNVLLFGKEIWEHAQKSQKQTPPLKGAAVPSQSSGVKMPFITYLKVRLGTLNYKDYSSGTPVIKQFQLNYTWEFHNISDIRQAVEAITNDLKRLGASIFAEALFKLVNEQLLGSLGISGQDMIKGADEATKVLNQGVKGIVDSITGL